MFSYGGHDTDYFLCVRVSFAFVAPLVNRHSLIPHCGTTVNLCMDGITNDVMQLILFYICDYCYWYCCLLFFVANLRVVAMGVRVRFPLLTPIFMNQWILENLQDETSLSGWDADDNGDFHFPDIKKLAIVVCFVTEKLHNIVRRIAIIFAFSPYFDGTFFGFIYLCNPLAT